ncbi:MAG: hypothetical protein AVDCRST_MAG05-3541, partial [uncultured Rubrobacteraceae bacterium]
ERLRQGPDGRGAAPAGGQAGAGGRHRAFRLRRRPGAGRAGPPVPRGWPLLRRAGRPRHGHRRLRVPGRAPRLALARGRRLARVLRAGGRGLAPLVRRRPARDVRPYERRPARQAGRRGAGPARAPLEHAGFERLPRGQARGRRRGAPGAWGGARGLGVRAEPGAEALDLGPPRRGQRADRGRGRERGPRPHTADAPLPPEPRLAPFGRGRTPDRPRQTGRGPRAQGRGGQEWPRRLEPVRGPAARLQGAGLLPQPAGGCRGLGRSQAGEPGTRGRPSPVGPVPAGGVARVRAVDHDRGGHIRRGAGARDVQGRRGRGGGGRGARHTPEPRRVPEVRARDPGGCRGKL